MKMPPFFIGAAVLFWGYEKNLLLPAIVLSLLIEGRRFTKTRWQLGKEDYIKISDLTSVLLLAAITLIVMNYEARHLLITVTGWLPLILLPLILAQVYGADDKIIIGTRIGSKKIRKEESEKCPEPGNNPTEKKSHHMHRPLDFSFSYAALTLFSAAAANSRHEAFFPLFFALTGWLLFANRGKAFSPLSFSIILVLGALLGFFGTKGVEKGYSNLNRMMMDLWETRFQNTNADPFKTDTAFGDIRRLKLSSRIVIRLQSSEPPPALLKEAGYNVFSKTFWFNRDGDFTATSMGLDDSWQLVDDLSSRARSLHIEKYYSKKMGLFPYPYGVEEVRDLDIVELTRNSEGLLRFAEGNTLQSYDMSYSPGRASTSLPSDYHLLIPEQEEPALLQVIEDLDLDSVPEEERLRRIQGFFQNNFSYSLTTRGKGTSNTPLTNFLLHSKAGHCELFATATALLLRVANIPSRYITGYAVAEKSFLEQGYIIRSRHAHAWTEAYIKGEWHVIDTTPGIWLEEEKSQSSFFEPIRDFFSFIRHQVNLFRARKDRSYNLPLSIAVILLTAFLIFRIYKRLNKEKKVEGQRETRKTFQEQDSPFTLIEAALNSKGPKRRRNEAFHEWLERISSGRRVDAARLTSLHRLHQKLRFDPHGLGEEEMTRLEAGVEDWLRQHSQTAERDSLVT